MAAKKKLAEKAKKATRTPKTSTALAKPGKPSAIYWPVKKVAEAKDAESARMTFDTFTSKGLKAHYVDEKGNPGKPMKTFDETAGGVVFL